MGPLGAQEMIAIFVLALLLFGPKKLPELGRMLGKALSEFRRAKSELKTTFESHLRELERETRLDEVSGRSDYSSSHYPYSYGEYGSPEATTSPNGSQAAPASQEDQPQPASEPVAGTVPRSSAQRSDPVSTTAEEKHSA